MLEGHFASELALWTRLDLRRSPEAAAAHHLAAAHSTACLSRLMPRREAEAALAKLPEALSSLIACAGAIAPPAGLPAAAWRIFAGLRPVAAPAAWFMLGEGDARLDLDPETGLNRYGCRPLPEPTLIAFSTSTAATLSADGLEAAESLRLRLMDAAIAGTLDATFASIAAETKADILAALRMSEDQAAPILAASGTIATLFATHAALPADAPVLVLVLGPEESGSGIPLVAQGLHPASRTPFGLAVAAKSAVRGFPVERLIYEGMAIRDEAGRPVPSEEMARRIGARVAAAVAAGQKVLLHVLEGSKTGLVVPGLAAVEALRRRFGPALQVIVDACQLRTASPILESYLAAECAVVATGSKFYAGPPFSAILLLPPAMAAAMAPLPAGLAAYSWRGDWPPAWEARTGVLPATGNPGLLMRWRAALVHMAACAAVPPDAIARVLAAFGTAVRACFAGQPEFHLMADSPSIFTFAVADPGGSGWQDAAALRRIYQRLNIERCSIGQPVALGEGPYPAGLRLAAGAPTVIELAAHPDPEGVLAERIGAVLDKVVAHL